MSEIGDPAQPYTTTARHAVFISYASADAGIAEQACAALEAAGIPCWIAPRDVRPGDPYAAAIVEAINGCRLMVIVLSKNAIDSPHVLREVERASSKKRPLLSIRVDSTALPAELEYFLSSNHWLDASGGPVERDYASLVAAVRGRLGSSRQGDAHPQPAAAPIPPGAAPQSRAGGRRPALVAAVAVLGLTLAYFAADRIWLHKRSEPATRATSAGTPVAATEKSIAVLPFADMSEKHDQEYFSDGMAEEIIDLLVKVPELKVPARTSSFYFKGKATRIQDIARELGVANILEGSVRKSGDHLRVTAQLVRADTGFHLWSETYDRQLEDVFKTQDEIAGSVVKALKVSLLKADAPSTPLTTSSEAYELYLQARALASRGDTDDTIKGYADLQQAVALDPKFALAWAALAEMLAQDNVDWSRVFSPGGSKRRTGETRSVELGFRLGTGARRSACGRGSRDCARARSWRDPRGEGLCARLARLAVGGRRRRVHPGARARARQRPHPARRGRHQHGARPAARRARSRQSRACARSTGLGLERDFLRTVRHRQSR